MDLLTTYKIRSQSPVMVQRVEGDKGDEIISGRPKTESW